MIYQRQADGTWKVARPIGNSNRPAAMPRERAPDLLWVVAGLHSVQEAGSCVLRRKSAAASGG
jgi:hypothetical protein